MHRPYYLCKENKKTHAHTHTPRERDENRRKTLYFKSIFEEFHNICKLTQNKNIRFLLWDNDDDDDGELSEMQK